MKSFLLVVGVGVLSLVLGGATFVQVEPEQPVTVVLVRHAEKQTTEAVDPKDPGLTAEGEERARALARLLGHAGVTHLYSTPLARTRDTLVPLSEALSLETVFVAPQEAERQVELLLALPAGSVAVVSGHSNTVPRLAALLGAELEGLTDHERFGPIMGDSEYDRLFVLTLPRGERTLVRAIELRYGR